MLRTSFPFWPWVSAFVRLFGKKPIPVKDWTYNPKLSEDTDYPVFIFWSQTGSTPQIVLLLGCYSILECKDIRTLFLPDIFFVGNTMCQIQVS